MSSNFWFSLVSACNWFYCMRDAAWKQKRHGGFAVNTLQASRCRCRHRRLITIEGVEDRRLRKRGKLPECLKWPRRYITHTHTHTHPHTGSHWIINAETGNSSPTRCHSDSDLALNQLAALQAISGPSPWRPSECTASVLEGLWLGSTRRRYLMGGRGSRPCQQGSHFTLCKSKNSGGDIMFPHRPAQKRLLCCSCVVRKVSLHSMTTRSRSRTVLCCLFSSLDLFGAASGRQQVRLSPRGKYESSPRPENGIKDKILVSLIFPLPCFSSVKQIQNRR